MTILRILALVASLAVVGHAQSDDGLLRFDAEGFSIKPLQSRDANPSGQRVVVGLFLAATGGFAPNINVIIQQAMPIDDFAKLSKQQFDTFGFKITKEAIVPPNEWDVEYEGAFQGRACHFLARAVRTDAKVYLVTATTASEQWEKTSPQLIECVKSFAVTNVR
jgi:hypothetical protein